MSEYLKICKGPAAHARTSYHGWRGRRATECMPGFGCVLTQATTAPIDIVKLPRTSQPIQFQTVKAVHECD